MHTLPNLPQSLACEVYALLHGLLPPPDAGSPESRAARADAAMAAVAALQPADAFEALFAAQIIAANAHALDCFDAAAKPGRQPEDVARSRAQAATMMRYMQNGLRMLKRDQALREKALAATVPATTYPAAAQPPGAPAADNAVQAETTAAPPDPDPPGPATADLKAAEEFATTYPYRAARIRRHRGLPNRLDFAAPRAAVIQALVDGTSPILRALDRQERATAKA